MTFDDVIDELMFDVHVRGCKPGDKFSNTCCALFKEHTIEEIKKYLREAIENSSVETIATGVVVNKNKLLKELNL